MYGPYGRRRPVYHTVGLRGRATRSFYQSPGVVIVTHIVRSYIFFFFFIKRAHASGREREKSPADYVITRGIIRNIRPSQIFAAPKCFLLLTRADIAYNDNGGAGLPGAARQQYNNIYIYVYLSIIRVHNICGVAAG